MEHSVEFTSDTPVILLCSNLKLIMVSTGGIVCEIFLMTFSVMSLSWHAFF